MVSIKKLAREFAGNPQLSSRAPTREECNRVLQSKSAPAWLRFLAEDTLIQYERDEQRDELCTKD